MGYADSLLEIQIVKEITTAKNVQNLFHEDFYFEKKKLLEDLDVSAVMVW